MVLRAAVEQHRGRLSVSDERLIQRLLSDPASAAFLSAAELAKRAGVHEATAVRLAKKLGYRGYPQLRADLQGELQVALGRRAEPADRVRRRLAHADDGDVLATLVRDETVALRGLPQHVGQASLDQAASALVDAQRVFLFGQGHATSLVDLLERRLRRSGYATVVLRAQGRELAEQVLALGRNDVVLALAFHSRPAGLRALLRHARRVGATTIGVSDALGPLLRPAPDHLLAAPRGLEAEFQSLVVPMTICNALVLTIARLDGGRSMAALDRLGGLIDEFESDARTKGPSS